MLYLGKNSINFFRRNILKIMITLSLCENPDGVTKIISQDLIDILTTILLTEKFKTNLALTLRLLSNILASDKNYKEGVLKQKALMDLFFSFSLDESKDLIIAKESCYCIINILVNSSKEILMVFLRNGYFVNLFTIMKNRNCEYDIVSILYQAIKVVLEYGEDIKYDFEGVNPVLSEILQQVDLDMFFEGFERNERVKKTIDKLHELIEEYKQE